MKWIIGLVALMPALALAAGAAEQNTTSTDKPPAFGLSNNVVGNTKSAGNGDDVAGETRHMLDQQAHSKPANHSEISAPVYVETQQRLSRSFKRDIKSFSKDQTTQSGGSGGSGASMQ